MPLRVVLPPGRQPNLAFAVLARALSRLGRDYRAVYGHRVLAVETFTGPARHTGACYAAANFRPLGLTGGYARSAGRQRRLLRQSNAPAPPTNDASWSNSKP